MVIVFGCVTNDVDIPFSAMHFVVCHRNDIPECRQVLVVSIVGKESDDEEMTWVGVFGFKMSRKGEKQYGTILLQHFRDDSLMERFFDRKPQCDKRGQRNPTCKNIQKVENESLTVSAAVLPWTQITWKVTC